jgi:transcriptional regulator with XRE-family HTH domain/quercetin dioxygenase-like cupin family protein
MPPSDVPWLGARLREERLNRGISLRSLARDVGVSASMISQIETSKSQPSVSTLYAITSALNISIEDVFTPPVTPRGAAAVSVSARNGAPAHAGAVVAPVAASVADGLDGGPPPVPDGPGGPDGLDGVRGRRRGPLVRPEARQALVFDSGVTWELLGELPPYPVDFLRVTYPPGSTSSSDGGGLMRHSGCEYGFLLSGELILTLGSEELRLAPGDAISFESRTPHSYRNEGTEPAVGVWFVIEEGR